MKELTPIDAIRLISGMYTPEDAGTRLAIVNLITRYVLGDAEKDYTEETLAKCGIKLIEANQ